MTTTQQAARPPAAQDGREAVMSRAYDHRLTEDRVYRQWLDDGHFTPPADWTRRPWTLMMPPPNITGVLHHGHAMMIAFEDVMTRWRRMMGDNTLYLPGTDHAGIATQNVVERELEREGRSRQEVGREAFVERVWEWREHHGNTIELQFRKLGTSCDWSRLRFTLDDQLSRAVREAFVRLYHKGLIYRGPYLVNWCPRCGTVISNLEVVHEETEGKLWTVRYDLDGGGHIEVATTRPETILGDTAVAVHPDDERYRALIGRQAILPALGRRIPIIADAAVEAAFGTGAVKVTPGHDPNDYEMGQRHDLPTVSIMNDDATLNDEAGPYAGMDRYAARAALLHDLEAEQRIRKVATHTHAVGTCDRCSTVVEPRISEQWFVKQTVLAQPAIQAVKDGRIKFVPQHFERIYLNWMENVHDWEISRQLWWGHRIPVWYCRQCPEPVVPQPGAGDPEQCPTCGGALEQDPDVLDTWFSSALWPFSTLGWPDQTEDLAYFYPTDVLETGYEIIFLWVARMIMTGIEFMGEPPFHHVYMHGIIRHQDGSKISKSNPQPGDDPLDVIEEYGADALRYWIVTGSTPGQDVRLSLPKIGNARNFANKLWNAARFVVLARDRSDDGSVSTDGGWANLGLAEQWILSRCHATIAEVTRQMEAYQFGEAGRTLEDFLWGEFCDWYIELSKLSLYAGGQGPWQDVARNGTTSIAPRETALAVLRYVLDASLRLLHPIMPFVTEEVWSHLHGDQRPAPALMVASWPQPGKRDPGVEAGVAAMIEVVRTIRNVRAEAQLGAGRWVPATIAGHGHTATLRALAPQIEVLARVRPLRIVETLTEKPVHALSARAGGAEIWLLPDEAADAAENRERLEAEQAEAQQQVARLEALLARSGFVEKAPAAVVERERGRLQEQRDRLAKVEARLAQLAR